MMSIKILITTVLLLNAFSSSAQDAREVLQNSYDTCAGIKNGYYEMTHYNKFMDSNDTMVNTSKCYFKKLANDNLDLPAFRWDDGTVAFYNGDELVTVQHWDSTATIMSKSIWPKQVEHQSYSYKLYSPFVNTKYPMLQHDTDLIDKRYTYKLLGDDTVGNDDCYHIQVKYFDKNDTVGKIKHMGVEYQYWIKKADFIPLQYSIAIEEIVDNDTMYQYEKNLLTRYEVNNLKGDDYFAVKAIPAYYTLKDYIAYQGPPLLTTNSVAPGWELYSLTNQKTNLHDYKGQLVLLDFFTKSCFPCMLALPGLQLLHEKYGKAGLKIIGVDIYDKAEDGIVSFLAKHGVKYTIVLGGREVGDSYHVSGIPTIYLLDKTGKIILTQVGYEKEQEQKLEAIIKTNL